jgi:hypothetical protein
MRFTKWGGKRHWRFAAEALGDDEFGWWYGSRAGTSMRRGFEEPIIAWYDFVILVPAAGRWVASWNGPAHVETAIYVDVTDRPVRTAGLVEAVDLDLDVVRLRDGSVRLLDEGEFEAHQVLYGYPPEEIAQARATADELLAMIGEGREPFGQVGDAWLAAFSEGR